MPLILGPILWATASHPIRKRAVLSLALMTVLVGILVFMDLGYANAHWIAMGLLGGIAAWRPVAQPFRFSGVITAALCAATLFSIPRIAQSPPLNLIVGGVALLWTLAVIALARGRVWRGQPQDVEDAGVLTVILALLALSVPVVFSSYQKALVLLDNRGRIFEVANTGLLRIILPVGIAIFVSGYFARHFSKRV